MNFDPISLLGGALGVIANFGDAGRYISIGIGLLASVPVLITALVALWHAVVMFFSAISLVFPGLKNFSDKLKALEATIDSGSNVALSWLDRLSAIKIPQKK